MLAPAELFANSALIVMGSEGRGEQLLKTNQDNGLLLRNGYTPPPTCRPSCDAFSQAPSRFGYAECKRGVMLSDPAWPLAAQPQPGRPYELRDLHGRASRGRGCRAASRLVAWSIRNGSAARSAIGSTTHWR